MAGGHVEPDPNKLQSLQEVRSSPNHADGQEVAFDPASASLDDEDNDMWAGVEDAGAPVQHSWENLNADEAGPSDSAGDVGRGRASVFTDMSTPAPSGGGLRLDVQAWERGMGDIISQVGLDRPTLLAPLEERTNDTENRLRILEEDRDVLRSQAVKLQSSLDSEREDRQIAQKAQAAAVEKLRQLDGHEGEAHSRDSHRLQELEATASLLRHKLEKARRNIQVCIYVCAY